MIKYSLVKRGDPRNPKQPKRVYASAQCIKKVSLKELALSIRQHGCAYSTGDFLAMAEILSGAIAEHLREGYQVELDNLGKFFITLECEGAESEETFDPNKHIKGIKAHWSPGKPFTNLRREATFEESINRRTERKLLRAERKGEDMLEI